MEQRKKEEIEYYDKEAEVAAKERKEAGSLAGFNPLILESYRFLYQLAKKNCQNKKVLDYGCGMGIHLPLLCRISSETAAIDLSRKSLEAAKERIRREKIKNVKFFLMDCEKLDFPDNYFDVVFDGGTFSSLDLDKAFSEISRVLKPGGILIGIETLGHNPLTNFKRKLNKFLKKRTDWAASHIFKFSDYKKANKYFLKKEIYYFHIVSWVVFPFLNFPEAKIALRILEKIDSILLTVPFLRKYAFKVVFVFYK